MATIAKNMGSFYVQYGCPKIFKRKRTYECEHDAMDMLKVYRDCNYISKEEYLIAKHEIQVADHDDAISDIMCKIRHKIKW